MIASVHECFSLRQSYVEKTTGFSAVPCRFITAACGIGMTRSASAGRQSRQEPFSCTTVSEVTNLSVAIVTGSAGLVGSTAAEYFCALGFDVVGVDNDMRGQLFGEESSTAWQRCRLEEQLGEHYTHVDLDIRDANGLATIFTRYRGAIELVIHAAAQPSHDWAAKDPPTDFTINANGTLNLLEASRRACPDAVIIFLSTNKVYGDTPNRLPLIEMMNRWEIAPTHTYYQGIREDMSIDTCLHSLFGASKVAADILVQEYARYFGMRTVCFRGGCLSGPSHSGAPFHGFLAYLMKCAATRRPYTIFGYLGKQVRDNIHSYDLIRAFDEFRKQPRPGEVYNIGGGRQSNCSMREAVDLCQEITGNSVELYYSETNRRGDHIWWISSLDKFHVHYPEWRLTYDVRAILQDIYDANIERWRRTL
jgi:CDP-paratose 2-epimerase